jgi:myosin-crossreactive antigen
MIAFISLRDGSHTSDSLSNFDLALVIAICLENHPFHSDFPILWSSVFDIRPSNWLSFFIFCRYVSLFISDFLNLGSVSL